MRFHAKKFGEKKRTQNHVKKTSKKCLRFCKANKFDKKKEWRTKYLEKINYKWMVIIVMIMSLSLPKFYRKKTAIINIIITIIEISTIKNQKLLNSKIAKLKKYVPCFQVGFWASKSSRIFVKIVKATRGGYSESHVTQPHKPSDRMYTCT